MADYIYKQKPHKCPVCGYTIIADILFGMPAFDPEMKKEINEGRLVLAGCIVSDNDPSWCCTKCDTVFYKNKTTKKV